MSAFPGYATTTAVRPRTADLSDVWKMAIAFVVVATFAYGLASLLGQSYKAAAYRARLAAVERSNSARADLADLQSQIDKLVAPDRVALWAEAQGFVDPVAGVPTRGGDVTQIQIEAIQTGSR